MKLYSTNTPDQIVSLREAVLRGLAPDGGLYMPVALPKLPAEFFDDPRLTFQDIAAQAAALLLKEEVPEHELERIVREAFSFELPLVPLSGRLHVLELFHGPTLAFKDFGARFMARLMAHFREDAGDLLILTATSGDTGSAVAQGFLGVAGIRVVILYPRGKVSPLQEKQFTTLGANITALEVEGSFDDCQRLVKEAFLDGELNRALRLTSANSINIARLLPQSFYYLYAAQQIKKRYGTLDELVFSVPSGNFGNLTAGLFAREMGLPAKKFVASTNENDVVVEYLNTGRFTPRPSAHTISNAMDVGNPSNFARLTALYGHSLETIREVLYGVSVSDEETRRAIVELFDRDRYVADPHTAVGYLGLKSYMRNNGPCTGVVLGTAHPAKFLNVIEELLPGKVLIPQQLIEYSERKKLSIPLKPDLSALRTLLLAQE